MDYLEIRYKKNGSGIVLNTKNIGAKVLDRDLGEASFTDQKITDIMGMDGYYYSDVGSALISRNITASILFESDSMFGSVRRTFEDANSRYGQFIFSDDPDIYWEGVISVGVQSIFSPAGKLYVLEISMEAQPTPRYVENGELIEGVVNGIVPTGTLSITENGEYNVREFEKAVVDVPDTGINPSGTKLITQNGVVDIEIYKYVDVKVPNSGGEGTGTPSEPTEINLIQKNISQNGTFYAHEDGADGYSSVVVNVSENYDMIDGGDFSFSNNSFEIVGGVA